MSDLLSEADVCKRWGDCSPRTLERYRAQGLVGIRVGKGVMYRIEDVVAFEDSRATRKVKRRRPKMMSEPEMDRLVRGR